MTFTRALSTNNYGPAKFIVDGTTVANGTHSTIATALTSASSGDTIFIRPGTYTENLTLKVGVNLTAYGSDSSLNGTGKVIISGTCTLTTAGSVTMSGIQLQTNSAALLAITGSAASIVNLFDCYLNCTNNTGITFSSSSSSAKITVSNCYGNLGTTGIGVFAHSSAGALVFDNSTIDNTGGSSTANTCSEGSVAYRYSVLTNPITTSSAGSFLLLHSNIDTSTQNVIAITAGGSSAHNAYLSTVASGTASAVTISGAMSFHGCTISSSNTNAITGAGTIIYSGIVFANTSSTINTTTQTIAGTLQGNKVSAPTAGMLGEQIRATVGGGAPVALVTTVAKTITSISCTPGVWDISGVLSFSAAGVVSATQGSVNTTTNTLGTDGDNSTWGVNAVAGISGGSVTMPSWRQTFTATTTVYLVASSVFTSTQNAYGRISATRVG